MLTKDDLDQIRKIVREEVENESRSIKDEMGADIAMSRMRIQEDIDRLENRVKNLEIRMAKMHKELKEEIKAATHFLDKDTMKTLKRVKRIEEHLRLPVSS